MGIAKVNEVSANTTAKLTVNDAVVVNETLEVTGVTTLNGTTDVNGTEIILDADGNTSITADTDNQIDIRIGGVDELVLTSTKADNLDDLAALAHADSNIIVSDGINWVVETGPVARTSLGLGTGNSPQFTAIELGHASDTTITRAAAGIIAIEGAQLTTFASGTRMLFQQTTAPIGWTKGVDAAYNDAALRFTTGVVGTGGADAFNTLFGTAKSTAGFTLTIAEIPSHVHAIAGNYPTLDPGAVTNVTGGTTGAAGVSQTNNVGGGGSHAHTLNNMNLKFVDVIVASKD